MSTQRQIPANRNPSFPRIHSKSVSDRFDSWHVSSITATKAFAVVWPVIVPDVLSDQPCMRHVKRAKIIISISNSIFDCQSAQSILSMLFSSGLLVTYHCWRGTKQTTNMGTLMAKNAVRLPTKGANCMEENMKEKVSFDRQFSTGCQIFQRREKSRYEDDCCWLKRAFLSVSGLVCPPTCLVKDSPQTHEQPTEAKN